jgi:hypothetical protein
MDKGREEPFLWSEERKLKCELARSHEDIFAWDGAGRGLLSHGLFPVLGSHTVERGTWVSRTIPVLHNQLEGLLEEIKGVVNAEYNEPTVVSLQPKFLGVLKKDAGKVKLAQALALLNAVSLTRSEITSSSEGSQRK